MGGGPGARALGHVQTTAASSAGAGPRAGRVGSESGQCVDRETPGVLVLAPHSFPETAPPVRFFPGFAEAAGFFLLGLALLPSSELPRPPTCRNPFLLG